MSSGDFCRVYCRVRAETKLGQTVGLALSSSDHFDCHSVVELLVTTPDAYPVWYTSKPLIIPAGEANTLYYRYCVVEGGTLRPQISYFEAPPAPAQQASRVIRTPGAAGGLQLLSQERSSGSSSGSSSTGSGRCGNDGNFSVDAMAAAAAASMDIVLEDQFAPVSDAVQRLGEEEADTAVGAKLRSLTLTHAQQSDQDMASGGCAKGFTIAGGGRLLITCYHLPISVKRQSSGEPFAVTWGDR